MTKPAPTDAVLAIEFHPLPTQDMLPTFVPQMLEPIKADAVDEFTETGHVDMRIILVCRSGPPSFGCGPDDPGVVTLHPNLDNIDRQALGNLVQRAARAGRAVATVVVMETWVLDGANADAAALAGVKDWEVWPGRKEALTIQAEGTYLTPPSQNWHAFIERDASGKGTLKPWNAAHNRTFGRFSNLVPERDTRRRGQA